MRDQAKWFCVSLGIHLGCVVAVICLTAGAIKLSPPITIDFTLDSSPIAEARRTENHKPAQPLPLSASNVTRSIPDGQQPLPTASAPAPLVSQAVVTTPVNEEPTVSKITSGAGSRQAPPVAHASAAIVAQAAPATTSNSGESRLSPEKARQKYLKEHFAYIRELIVKKLVYPPSARRMGWSGKVVVAFTISEDGSVLDLRVVESSDYSVLDKSATDTIRKTAPFPRPPVKAEIVMPVDFRLM